jgi:hypothetical protein
MKLGKNNYSTVGLDFRVIEFNLDGTGILWPVALQKCSGTNYKYS